MCMLLRAATGTGSILLEALLIARGLPLGRVISTMWAW